MYIYIYRIVIRINKIHLANEKRSINHEIHQFFFLQISQVCHFESCNRRLDGAEKSE